MGKSVRDPNNPFSSIPEEAVFGKKQNINLPVEQAEDNPFSKVPDHIVKKKVGGEPYTPTSDSSPTKSDSDFQSQLQKGSELLGNSSLSTTIDLTTPSGVKIPIEKSKIPSVLDTEKYTTDLQKNISDGKLTPFDENIIVSSSTKSPVATAAYLKGDNKTGQAVDRIDYINKKKKDIENSVAHYNEKLAANYFDNTQPNFTSRQVVDANEVLSNPQKASDFLQEYTASVKDQNDKLKNAIPINGATTENIKIKLDDINNQFKNNQSLLVDNIVSNTADEDAHNNVLRSETVKKIAQRLDPVAYKNAQDALNTKTGVEALSDQSSVPQMVGSLIEEIQGSNVKKQDDETLNSQIGYADIRLNDAYRELANNKAAVAHLSGDEEMMNQAKALYAKVDDSLVYKYPSIVKAQMAEDIGNQIANESGVLKGSQDEAVSMEANVNRLNGITSDRVKQIIESKGWDKDPAKKDAAEWLIDHPENIKDASVFGGVGNSFLEPFKNLGLGLLDIAGVRDKRDLITDKTNEQLFPKEFNGDEVKPEFSVFGHDVHLRNTANTVSSLAGMTAIAAATGSAGRAIGLGLDAVETAELASTGIDIARKGQLLAKTAAASERAASYASFAIPSVDENIKVSYDFIDNDAQRAAFVTMGAILNGEGGKLLELGSVGKVPGLAEDFVNIAKGLSEKTLTKDAANELLKKGESKYVDYVAKFGKKTAEFGGNTLKGAATMAYFGFMDKVNKIAFGDPNAKSEDLLPEAGHAFVDGILSMVPLGFVQTFGSPKTNPNSSMKGFIYDMARFPDAAQDVFKLGKTSEQDYNSKMQILNTSVSAKNALDATESELGIKLQPTQRAAFVANRTVESFLREKADKVIGEDAKSKERKAHYLLQADELNRQSTDALDGLQFTKTLEPLYDLYNAEKIYDRSLAEFQQKNTPESEKALLDSKAVFEGLQSKYFNDKYGTVIGAIPNDKSVEPEKYIVDEKPATRGQVEEILKGGQAEADKHNIEYTGKDDALHKQLQDVGATTENDKSVSPKSRETINAESATELYDKLEGVAPAHYLDPLDKKKSVEELQNQALTATVGLKKTLGGNEELTAELISRNSTEEINNQIQTLKDSVQGEDVDPKEKAAVKEHVALLEKGLEKKGEINESAKKENKVPISKEGEGIANEKVNKVEQSTEEKRVDIERRRREELLKNYDPENNIIPSREEVDGIKLKYDTELSDLNKSNIEQINKENVQAVNADNKTEEVINNGGTGAGADVPPITSEDGGTGITHAQTEEIRKDKGLGEYEKEKQTIAEWDVEADKRIANGDMPKVIDKMKDGKEISDVEQRMMGKYISTLNEEVTKSPTKESIASLKEAVELSDRVGGSQIGRSLAARKGTFLPEDSLGSFLLDKEASQGAPLTDKQIEDKTKQYNELKKANEDLAAALKIEEEKNAALIAEKGINKARAIKSKESKKTHDEYVKERNDVVQAIKDKWKNAGKDTLSSDLPYRQQLAAIAPEVKKYVQSLVNEGVDKLDNIVNNIHADLKDIVSKKDILDIIGGKYDEKKQTLSEKNTDLRLLKREAQLLDEIQQARKGEESAKNEVVKRVKTRRIQELENKLKEIRKLNKERVDEDAVDEQSNLGKPKSEAEINRQKEDSRNSAINKKIKSLESDIKNKNYDKEPEKIEPLPLSRETLKLKDKVIELEKKIALERYKDQKSKLSNWEKSWDKFQEVSQVRRLIQTSVDASVWFRQLAPLVFNPRKWDIAKKFIITGANSVFSQKKYDRYMDAIHKSPDYKNQLEDGIRYNELDSIDPKMHNEMYPKSFIYKIPVVKQILTASQRIADSSLNVARYELYEKYKRALLQSGVTRESDPEVYKEMAKLVMNSTGSGNLLSAFENRKAEKLLGATFYGARLMAANINTLNPAYYAKMPKEIRKEAIKDVASFTVTTLATGLALVAAGGKVSMNPDDPDFLQARFGDKVYDISGGKASYIRTFMRWVEAGYARATKSKYEANKSMEFAWSSTIGFFRKKLAPNTSYIVNMFVGKDAIGKDSDWKDIYEQTLPLYFDDSYKAIKEEGMTGLFTVLLPNILGIGYSSYYSEPSAKSLDETLQRNLTSDELNKETVKNYNDGGRVINDKEFTEYVKKRDAEIEKSIKELYVGTAPENLVTDEEGEPIEKKYSKMSKEEIVAAISSIKSRATKKTKRELFGKKPESTDAEEEAKEKLKEAKEKRSEIIE